MHRVSNVAVGLYYSDITAYNQIPVHAKYIIGISVTLSHWSCSALPMYNVEAVSVVLGEMLVCVFANTAQWLECIFYQYALHMTVVCVLLVP